MNINLADYLTLVFDCDGVILNSNSIKTQAFYRSALPWGVEAANKLVAYHVANGGISRYKKFSYFLDSILPEFHPSLIPGRDGPGLAELLLAYTEIVCSELITCAVADGLEALRSATPSARWLIVSGGDQLELRHVLTQRKLASYFDGGIFGSPDCKDSILARESYQQSIRNPSLFLGDSRYDHEVSVRFDMNFVFVYGWSDFLGWPDYVKKHHINSVFCIKDLVRHP